MQVGHYWLAKGVETTVLLALGMVWRRGSSEERSRASDFFPWYAVSIRVSIVVVVIEAEDFFSCKRDI